jgi:hypothetical protein
MPRWPDMRQPYEYGVGLCCGCGHERPLIRVADSRYRCRGCAALEAQGIETHWIPGEPRIDR